MSDHFDRKTARTMAEFCWHHNAGERELKVKMIPAIEAFIFNAQIAAWNAAIEAAAKVAGNMPLVIDVELHQTCERLPYRAETAAAIRALARQEEP